jgi:hypothetical protein
MEAAVDRRKRIIAAGITAAAVVAGGAGLAVAGGTGEDGKDKPITGSALPQAEKAALDHAGQGSVTGTEVGDEESYYEVEVTLDDGSETDVQLDRSFDVVGNEVETGSEADEGSHGNQPPEPLATATNGPGGHAGPRGARSQPRRHANGSGRRFSLPS